jgi:acetyltransferase-like isoleucine patch superfamily enzyme
VSVPDQERTTGALTLSEAVAAGILTMGEHSFGWSRIVNLPGDTAKVRIGKYCSLGAGVKIMVGGEHRVDWVTTFPLRVRLGLPGANADGHPTTKGDVAIGNDVWVCIDSKILSGVTIGNGAVIGTNAVVAGDVRPYAIVAGNPAREIRRRFSDDVVDALQRIAWWDWPEETVRERIDSLCGTDIGCFIRRFDVE